MTLTQLAFELDAFLTMGNQVFLMTNSSESIERGLRAYRERVQRTLTSDARHPSEASGG